MIRLKNQQGNVKRLELKNAGRGITRMKRFSPYAFPISIVVLYAVYFFACNKFFFDNGLFIAINEVSSVNVSQRAVIDCCAMLLFPLGLIITYRQRLEDLGFKKSALSILLLAAYVLVFFFQGDFTVRGTYHPFFYLIIVAMPEELIFRGYLYLQLKKQNRLAAILISGALFGVMHAILPGILAGLSVQSILVNMLSEIGGGVVGGGLFILLLEFSESLFVPIMVHALLDYAKMWGLWLTIATFGYLLFINNIKKRKRREDKL